MPVNPWFVSRWRTTRYASVHSFIASLGLCAMLWVPMSHATNSELRVNVSLTILQPTCSLNDEVTVPLGDINQEHFRNGDIDKPFKINLTNCQHTKNIKVKFTNNGSNSEYKVQTRNGTDNGLLLKIKYQDTVSEFNTDITVDMPPRTLNFEIPFGLHVMRSSSPLVTGEFEATIPFSVTYL